jgi:hypothetical protein
MNKHCTDSEWSEIEQRITKRLLQLSDSLGPYPPQDHDEVERKINSIITEEVSKQ